MMRRFLPALVAAGLLARAVHATPSADEVVGYQIETDGRAGLDRMPGVVFGPPHEPALDRLAGLVSQTDVARARKKCQRKLATARHAAKSLSVRIASLTRQNCLAPVDRATMLAPEVVDLANRTMALSKSGFCANR